MSVPLQVGSTTSSLPSLTEHYGSIAEQTEAARMEAELELEEENEVKAKKNINVEAAMLHAVTDMVRETLMCLAEGYVDIIARPQFLGLMPLKKCLPGGGRSCV